MVEFGGGMCFKNLFGSGVSCTLFQINLTCLLRNYCGCRVIRERECTSRWPVGRKLQNLPKPQWSSNKAKRGKEVLLWSEKCACVLSALQKLYQELLTVLLLPWSWCRSPFMCYTIMPFTIVFHLGMLCCCFRAFNILSCSNPQQPPVTWQLNQHSIALHSRY